LFAFCGEKNIQVIEGFVFIKNQLMLISTADIIFQFTLLFGMNLIAIFIVVYLIYYRRYHDKKGFIAYMLFNIFLFTVVFFLIRNDSVVSLGFAIFGILSLIRLRSDTNSKIEITYYFIAMSIALLNGMVGAAHIPLMIWVNAILVFCVFIFDHPMLFDHTHEKILYRLDSVPANLLADKEETKNILWSILSVEVMEYEVIEVDSIRDSSKLRVTYKK